MMDTEEITVLEMVEDHQVACEFDDYYNGGACDKPAAWIMFRHPCACGDRGPGLACGACKDARMASGDGVACVDCGEVTVPARRRYSRIEPL